MTTLADRTHAGGSETALLVIGYGNELRSDDGVGPRTAEAVAEWGLPAVRTLTCHQLTPELAVPIASAQCVVFVDAQVGGQDAVELRELQPRERDEIMAHAANPDLLLFLAKEIFGRSPMAFWLTIPVENLAFGEELSERAREGLESALGKIRELLSPTTK